MAASAQQFLTEELLPFYVDGKLSDSHIIFSKKESKIGGERHLSNQFSNFMASHTYSQGQRQETSWGVGGLRSLKSEKVAHQRVLQTH